VVLIDEGEAKGLGEIYDDALGELDTQEANPDLKQICSLYQNFSDYKKKIKKSIVYISFCLAPLQVASICMRK
jgi:hypothetical protein